METLLHYSDVAHHYATLKSNLIQEMPFETELIKTLGFSLSQLRFAIALFLSVPVSVGVRLFSSPTARHLYALVSGFLLVYYPFGDGVAQVVPPLLWTYLTMALLPKSCGTLSWANMVYLIWLHVINASGEAWSAGQMDFTGGSMVLVLKLISLATSYQDAKRRAKHLSSYAEAHKVNRLPGPLAYLGYCFAFGNLLCGPWGEYADYQTFAQLQGAWGTGQRASPFLGHALWLVAQALVFMGAMVTMTDKFGVNALYRPWFKSQPLLVRLLLHWPIGIVGQLRYYFVWKLAEAANVCSGLDLAGHHRDHSPKWGRMCNVNFWGVQLSEYSRAIPQSWNIATGTFLRRYVYDRLTPAGKRPGFPQLLATQLVSGVWHGLYPGYLLFFASSALMMQSCSGVLRLEATVVPEALKNSFPAKVLRIALAGLLLDHLSLTFVVLDWDRSVGIYKDVHYIPHILMFALALCAWVIPAPRKARSGTAAAATPSTEERAKKE